eukprot:CAMPEP_0115677162 /NCGR_PEP_ID=MMETSP0272-20121206/55076_1 /TAXON_ID=71861 /ORGANISM="Scrippsiella trochoidea, Strain CCMP3099" /LENGTH=58 /DNA_ID=CAMNT_0003116257 /DNA_START=114 /DNA_END=290 /DNA_ORIENTATION=+
MRDLCTGRPLDYSVWTPSPGRIQTQQALQGIHDVVVDAVHGATDAFFAAGPLNDAARL